MRIETPCAYCGTVLSRIPSRVQKSPKQFCNRSCKGAYRSQHYTGENALTPRTRIDVECANCKKPMSIPPSRSRKTICCSRECMAARRSTLYQGAGSSNWKGGKVAVACTLCGKELMRSQYKARTHRPFCNQQCWGIWAAQNRIKENHVLYKGEPPERACDWCGEIYRRRMSPSEHRYKATFCSLKCQGAWQATTRTGENCGAWRGGNSVYYYGPNWHAQKRAARKRDGYKCQHCGKPQKKCTRALDVHHVKPFKTFGYIPNENDAYLQANDLTNLITLCTDCHKKAEWNKIPIQPYLL